VTAVPAHAKDVAGNAKDVAGNAKDVPGNAEDVPASYYTLISYGAYGIADAIRDNPGYARRWSGPSFTLA
jgi:hypothetical protein